MTKHWSLNGYPDDTSVPNLATWQYIGPTCDIMTIHRSHIWHHDDTSMAHLVSWRHFGRAFGIMSIHIWHYENALVPVSRFSSWVTTIFVYLLAERCCLLMNNYFQSVWQRLALKQGSRTEGNRESDKWMILWEVSCDYKSRHPSFKLPFKYKYFIWRKKLAFPRLSTKKAWLRQWCDAWSTIPSLPRLAYMTNLDLTSLK